VLKQGGDPIGEGDLPVEYRSGTLLDNARAVGETALRDSLHASERDLILRTLERCGGNRHKAAEILGIHPATMFRKLNRLGIGRGEPQSGSGDASA
jgi:DNA-binding NtrC family response regulator